jgi:hypothetical protein
VVYLSSTSTSITVPPGQIHPIWTYYVYSTNIYYVMKRLSRQFLITTNDFAPFLPVDDKEEIRLLLETLHFAFPVPQTTVVAEFSYDQLLLNMFFRVFGFYNNPNIKFPRSVSYNSGFKTLLETTFLNIAQGIWSKGSTFQLLQDPAALNEHLIDLKEMLLPSETNTIDWVNKYWVDIFTRFLAILDNKKIIRDKLGIIEVGRDKILIALGRKFNVRVPSDTLYRFDLANYLNTFLLRVEKTNWNINQANNLYNNDFFFKLLFSAYARVEKRDFKREVQFIFPRSPAPLI